jgi:cyclopropane fatty-acyl-phospholipid synthase-like methyltransferase
MQNDYWENYWNDPEIIKNTHPQKQVLRTVAKLPVESEEWQRTLDYISNIIELKIDDELLDLCAGNSLITIPFAQKCRQVSAIDISKELLSKIDILKNKNIQVQVKDVRTLDLSEKSFSKIIMYASIQYFTEKETILLLENAYKWLYSDGLFFIGDIPDLDKKWNFYNTRERKKAYFESIKSEKPIIGTWFTKDFLLNVAKYVGFSKCQIFDQPKSQINSHYRFDLLLKK